MKLQNSKMCTGVVLAWYGYSGRWSIQNDIEQNTQYDMIWYDIAMPMPYNVLLTNTNKYQPQAAMLEVLWTGGITSQAWWRAPLFYITLVNRYPDIDCSQRYPDMKSAKW